MATTAFFCAALLAFQVSSLVGSAAAQDKRVTSKPFNFFVSGHSLNDNPFAQYLAAIAASQGFETRWNQQIVIGSPLRWRTWGEKGDWSGYRVGKNANHRNDMDVIRELRAKHGRDAYQFLIVAEGHHTVSALRWNDSARFLRHFHERLIDGNPAGRTVLYEPWESIKDLSNPAPWIKLERAGTKVWGCVVRRINTSLEHEGRLDRVSSVPIGSGLATLVERALAERLPGISTATPLETMKRIFTDDVHLTRLGVYYAALLTYLGVTDGPPQTFWHPPEVTKDQAASLQGVALQFIRSNSQATQLTLEDCRKLMVDSFCDDWNSYVPGKWAGPVHECKPYFARSEPTIDRFGSANPFAFDAKADASYWFPPMPP